MLFPEYDPNPLLSLGKRGKGRVGGVPGAIPDTGFTALNEPVASPSTTEKAAER